MTSFAKLKNKIKEDSGCRIPNELLLKIFDHLNIADLFKCSFVCKNWHTLTLHCAYWLKWTKAFKLEKEVNQIVSSLNSIEPNSSKIAFKKVLCQKRNLNLFKLNSQICKKINNYTKLPDLKQLLNNTLTLIWHLEFYDSKDRLLFKFNSIEQNVFEASCSIIWSDLTQLNNSIQKVKVFATIPVYMDLKNGKLVNFAKNKKGFMNLNESDRTLIYETKFNINDKNLLKTSIYKDSMIQLFEFNKDLLIATWTANNDTDIAFITFSTIFSFDFVSNILTKKKHKIVKNNKNDLELDKDFGLHDYHIYFCIRNQTSTSFISLSQTIYKARVEVKNNIKYLLLNVIDSNISQNDMGHHLTMLPRLSWSTEGFKKNIINLVAIVDLCVFDSNNHLIISDSFPVNINANSNANASNFTSDENFEFVFHDENYILNSEISCLKDNSFVSKLQIYLNLKFVDSWFDTNFMKN